MRNNGSFFRAEYVESGNKKWWRIFADIFTLQKFSSERKLPIKSGGKDGSHVNVPIKNGKAK